MWNAPVIQPVDTGGGYGSITERVEAKSPANCNSIMIFSFNKSSVSDLDGYTLNNSRSLIFNFTVHTGTDSQYDTFVEYLRVAIVFNSNIDVKD